MSLRRVVKFLPLVFIAFLAAKQTDKGPADELGDKFKRWNDSLPEDRIYVQCDKPFYSPGETVWFSAFVRDGCSFRASPKSDIVYVELLNPKGSVEKQVTLIAKKGIACGDFTINETSPGGLYTLKAYTSWQKNDPDPAFFEKELLVQAVVLPRLKMKLDFMKKAYGAGDKVTADLILETNENKPLALHPVEIAVSIAGVSVFRQSVKSDANGKTAISFALPEKLTSSDGLLNAVLDYEGQTESISRSIPIVLNRIALTFYPEGGDLVNSLVSRVAFKAVNEFGKGADIEGYITGKNGKKITGFESFHNGMGAFDLTPGDGERYTAHITRPTGIKETFMLPEAMPQGYVLTIDNSKRAALSLSIGSSRTEKLSVFIQVRGKIYFSKTIDAKKGMNTVSVDLAAFPAGVAQVTLFDSREIERAERLVFVNKTRTATVTIKTDKEKYLPREKVKMTITATDESGMRMPGHFALAVTDDQLLSFSDDKSSTVMSHMLAEADVKGRIEEPRFYFDPKEQKADKALDYLLLTSGWRRFTWKRIMEEEIPAPAYEGERAIIAGVIMDGQTRNGAPGVDVRIIGSKLQTRTDSSGAFSFKNVDLYDPVTIEARRDRLQAQASVAAYTSSLQLWLTSMDQIQTLSRALDGGAEGEMPDNAMAVAAARPDRNMVQEAIAEKLVKGERKRAINRNYVAQILPPKMAAAIPPAAKKKAPAEPFGAGMKKLRMEKVLRAPLPAAAPVVKDEMAPMREMLPPPPPPEPVPGYYRVREFAVPDYREQQQPSQRTDFRSTVYWKGDVELKNNGTAEVEFYTSDAVTSFRAVSEGFTTDGNPGRAEQVFYSKLPFELSAKLPPVLITGDTVELPLLIRNTTAAAIRGKLTVALPAGCVMIKSTASNGSADADRSIEAGKSQTVPVRFRVATVSDSANIVISFNGNSYSDAVKAPLRIIPQGFPVELSFSGNDLQHEYAVKIDNCVAQSINASLMAYPSVISDLLAGIESILQEPYGCFEQTSVSSYPNALVVSYLKSTGKADPEIVARAEELLDKGYNRLVTFETKDKGYEWFGQPPGHEALTAYGLMQFNDMQAAGEKVDRAMVDRTTEWLMKRRDNNGGFLRNPQALDSYGGADQHITDAYIVYALAEAGRRDIQKELDASVAYARESGDPYVIGLIANALSCFGNSRQADDLLSLIIGKQAADGSWCGLTHSITRSGGLSLKLETTALICLAIMKSKQPAADALTSGIKYIVASRSGSGGFGATQSTILSLKALTAYAQFARKTDSPGTIVIAVDKKDVAKKAFAAGERGAIVIDSLQKFISEGNHAVTVRFEGTKHALPYSLAVSYYTMQPASSPECKVTIETAAAASSVKVGQTVRVTTTLKNTTNEGQPMTIAIVGLPAGLSPQPWQLKEIQEKKVADFYEVNGSTVVFYFRQMKPGETRTINLDCKAAIPGYYTAPASRAYLYYTNEFKSWTSLSPIKITL